MIHKATDILKSCRESSPNEDSDDLHARCLSAADEIERLRGMVPEQKENNMIDNYMAAEHRLALLQRAQDDVLRLQGECARLRKHAEIERWLGQRSGRNTLDATAEAKVLAYAAAAAEREAILQMLPGGQWCDPQLIADMIRARGEDAR